MRRYFGSSKVRGEGKSVLFINRKILLGPEDARIVSQFSNDNEECLINYEEFQWNVKPFSTDNDYLWNTADLF